MAAEVFCCRVNDYIYAHLERLDVIWGRECGIYECHHTVLLCYFHYRYQIQHAQVGIGRRFGKDYVRIRSYGLLDSFSGRFNNRHLYAEFRQQIGSKVTGLTIAITGEYNVLSPLHVRHQCDYHGTHTC